MNRNFQNLLNGGPVPQGPPLVVSPLPDVQLLALVAAKIEPYADSAADAVRAGCEIIAEAVVQAPTIQRLVAEKRRAQGEGT